MDFALDFADGLRRDVDELHANAETGQAVTDFAARADFSPGEREAKTEIEHRAFGNLVGVLKNIP